MRCPYCDSMYVSQQNIPFSIIFKALFTGAATVLIGWPLRLLLLTVFGIGIIMLGIIIALVTIIPVLLRKKKAAIWECGSCCRAFEQTIN